MPGGNYPTRSNARRDLLVVFDIEPAPDCSCPLGGVDGEIEGVRHQFAGETCLTDTTFKRSECPPSSGRDCSEVVHAASTVEATCPCTVFGNYDCVPELDDIVDGRLRIETYLSNRERLPDLVDALREVSDALHLRQLKRIDNGNADRSRNTATFDLYEMTEKQREAVSRAVAQGYYSSPRDTSIGELAEEFEISASALSQRLNAAESKLATSAFPESSSES